MSKKSDKKNPVDPNKGLPEGYTCGMSGGIYENTGAADMLIKAINARVIIAQGDGPEGTQRAISLRIEDSGGNDLGTGYGASQRVAYRRALAVMQCDPENLARFPFIAQRKKVAEEE